LRRLLKNNQQTNKSSLVGVRVRIRLLLGNNLIFMELAPRLSFLEKVPSLPVEEVENIEKSASWRELKSEAGRQVELLLAERTLNFELLNRDEQTSLLRDLLAEFGAVKDGNEIPLDNSYRFLVEALAGKLAALELQIEMEELQARLEAVSS